MDEVTSILSMQIDGEPLFPEMMANAPPAETAPTPTPEEDAAAIAKEAAEQAALPYTWKQTLLDVDVSLSVPSGLRGRDLAIVIAKTSLSVGVKGKEPIIKVFSNIVYFWKGRPVQADKG